MTQTAAASAAMPGHFYAVGVGPGKPDLLTIRAARTIEAADRILAPRSERSEISLALKAVEPHLNAQHIDERVYPMTRDEAGTQAFWGDVARDAAAACEAGEAVVHITIGDPLIYATSSYLLASLTTRLPAERIHVVPGISAFQAAASRLHETLLLQEDRMGILTGADLDAVAAALDQNETVVLFKVSRNLDAIRDLLGKRGLLGAARLACYVEQDDRELLCTDLGDLDELPRGYMATLIVRTGSRAWSCVDATGGTPGG
jgi:precorrin-2/cobalt-factor-2 C20-methyltransferase